MTSVDLVRIAWVLMAIGGITASCKTLQMARRDWRIARGFPWSDPRRRVAETLLRDELGAVFVQTAFIVVAVSAWIDPSPNVARGFLFVVASLTLGVLSCLRLRDRKALEE